jgi:Uma2 family endonuclease
MTLRELNNHIAIDDLAEELDGRPIPNLRMTEQEFVDWCRGQEGIKAEWVDGEVIVMAPANFEHVDLNGWLYRLVSQFVEARELGVVLGGEFTARFASRRRRRVPDLMFIANS